MKLLEYRQKMNLTQDELAEKSGVSVRTIQRIEAGGEPKGYTLKVLSEALGISESELASESAEQHFNYQVIKLINLSSLLFIIPLVNIVLPLIIMYWKNEVNKISRQIVSIQILWTLISGVLILISPFIRRLYDLGIQLTLIILIMSILINFYIIIQNAIAIDKRHQLLIKTNFSLI